MRGTQSIPLPRISRGGRSHAKGASYRRPGRAPTKRTHHATTNAQNAADFRDSTTALLGLLRRNHRRTKLRKDGMPPSALLPKTAAEAHHHAPMSPRRLGRPDHTPTPAIAAGPHCHPNPGRGATPKPYPPLCNDSNHGRGDSSTTPTADGSLNGGSLIDWQNCCSCCSWRRMPLPASSGQMRPRHRRP
jgi:hypothetical protein